MSMLLLTVSWLYMMHYWCITMKISVPQWYMIPPSTDTWFIHNCHLSCHAAQSHVTPSLFAIILHWALHDALLMHYYEDQCPPVIHDTTVLSPPLIHDLYITVTYPVTRLKALTPVTLCHSLTPRNHPSLIYHLYITHKLPISPYICFKDDWYIILAGVFQQDCHPPVPVPVTPITIPTQLSPVTQLSSTDISFIHNP